MHDPLYFRRTIRRHFLYTNTPAARWFKRMILFACGVGRPMDNYRRYTAFWEKSSYIRCVFMDVLPKNPQTGTYVLWDANALCRRRPTGLVLRMNLGCERCSTYNEDLRHRRYPHLFKNIWHPHYSTATLSTRTVVNHLTFNRANLP